MSNSADYDAAWRSRGGRQNMGRNELLAVLRATENRIADIEALADDRERKGLITVSIDSLRAALRRTTVFPSADPEPQQSDGPEYHAELQFWKERQTNRTHPPTTRPIASAEGDPS